MQAASGHWRSHTTPKKENLEMTKMRDERIGNKRIVELVLTEEEIAVTKEHKDFRNKLLKRRQEHGN